MLQNNDLKLGPYSVGSSADQQQSTGKLTVIQSIWKAQAQFPFNDLLLRYFASEVEIKRDSKFFVQLDQNASDPGP